MKNQELIITHLNESIRALQRIVICLETGHTFGTRKPMRYRHAHFRSHLEQVQHHINYAWPLRNMPDTQAISATDEEFQHASTLRISSSD
ncbi:hypothetical protein [Pseudomonas sp. PE-S1G-1]|uniref:hypothetical protein n=1 Tax=Pseudomonas sp. PE-S1G-1 TaxID=1986995 RepID=UPI000B40402B|nr:hypothetical protein [Pseudomonas sp. PE-S1G-1]